MTSTMPTTDGNYPDSNSIAKASPQDPTEERFQENKKMTGHSKRDVSKIIVTFIKMP